MTEFYQTHDNGGRPYLVEIQPCGTISVYRMNRYDSFEENDPITCDSEKLLFTWNNPITVFIGESPETDTTRHGGGFGPQYKGNSILIETEPFKYVFIGNHISSFETNGVKIVSYLSEVGNNDVPYPYATDENGSTYLIIENIILDSIPDENKKDPYGFYYSQKSKYADIFDFNELCEEDGMDTYYYNIRYFTEPVNHYRKFYANNNLFITYEDNRPNKLLLEEEFVDIMKQIENAFHYKPLKECILDDPFT